MKVAVFADVHAHGDALDAVMAAAVDARVAELWCLGDIVGSGPDPARVTGMVRAYCAVALAGNHDYGASGSVDRAAFGPPGAPGPRSLELAAAALETSGDLQWLGSRKPAARRGAVQCWHASPRNPVWEFVTPANVQACLHRQRERLGLVGHTHAAAAWRARPGGGVEQVRIRAGRPLDLADGKWLLNPGAAGAPFPARGGWSAAMEAHGRAGAWWLEVDLDERFATWRRAPFDPRPALERARTVGLVEGSAACPTSPFTASATRAKMA